MRDLWLLVVAAIVVSVRAGEVCYDHLGCFSDGPPYGLTLERPIARYPWSPETINTRYLLFTRQNPDQFQEIDALNVSTVSSTKFSHSRKSYFIIHGFLSAGDDGWLVDMCQTFLQVSDVNCFCVDWHIGAFALYTQAANNVRVVGAELAYFVNYLLEEFRYPLTNIYLIGHSLGAQVAGEAGKRRPGIARITGLDPAGPYFQNTPPEVRLNPSDAIFVDVIHTDGSSIILNLGLGGFGTSQLVGDLDFFPNGGTQQPGCPSFYRKLGDLDSTIDGLDAGLACNHERSHMLFTKSILYPDGFVSYPGSSYSAFQKGAGFPCDNGSCAMMGYYADLYTQDSNNSNTQDSASQEFFLTTGDAENMLRWRYQVTLNLTGTMFLMGSFNVSLCGKVDCSSQYVLHSGFIHSGRTYSSFVDVDLDIYPVIKVEFSWQRDIIEVFPPTLGVTAMEVQYGPSGTMFHFCGNEVTEEGKLQTLESCNVNSKINS